MNGEKMIDNSYYSQDGHGPYELHDIGNLELEEGGTIRGCTLAYATFGTLDAAKDNAILIPTWYSGTNKIIEQVYIGKGRALDPDKYFIVIVNQIGNGLSTSPHNTPAPGGMRNFPHVRIGDDVRAQHKFVTEEFRAGTRRLNGCAADLRMGGTLPRHGEARRAHRRHREKYGPRFPFHRNTGRGDHVRPRFQQGFLFIPGGCARRSVASRQIVGGNGVEHRVFSGKSTQGIGLFVPGRFHHQLHVCLFLRDGSERSAVHGMEMAARRSEEHT